MLTVYDVYQHPITNKYQAVKQGFSWPAFFFMSLWAFSRRLYFFGMVLTVVVVFSLAIEVLIKPQNFWMETVVSLMQVGCYALFAWFANDVRRWFLGRKRFEKCASVSAKSPSRAIRQYIGELAKSGLVSKDETS